MTLLSTALLLSLISAPPAPAPARDSIAVFSISVEQGVTTSLAKLVNERVAFLVREAGAFARVITTQDIESVLSLEQQRQALDCSAESCIAEVAAGLNVDFVLNGSLGRLGDSYLLGLRITDVRKATAVAVVSERVRGSQDDTLFDGAELAVWNLLNRLGRPHQLKEPHAATPPAAAVQPAQPVPSVPPVKEAPGAGSAKLWWALAGAGGLAGLGGLVLAGVLGVVAYAAVGGAVLLATQGMTAEGRQGPLADGAGAAAGLVALVAVAAPSLAVAAAVVALGVFKGVTG